MTIDPAKDELQLLPRVGPKLADAMREVGLYTIEDVASASMEELSAVPGLGPKRAAMVKQAATGLLLDRNEPGVKQVTATLEFPGDGPAPWERQPGEPVKYYRWFCAFRDLGPGRTLTEAYQAIFPHRRRTRAPSGWNRVSRQWNWEIRAAAWDGAREAR